MSNSLPKSNHRDDVEPSSAAGIIENTYDSARRPSRWMSQEIAPTNDVLANDPGSLTHDSADDILRDNSQRPIEDREGILSRKSKVKNPPVKLKVKKPRRR